MVNKKDIDDLKADLKSYFDAGLKDLTSILSVKCDDIVKECREAHNIHDNRLTALEAEHDSTKQQMKSLQEKLDMSEAKVIQMEAKLLETNLRFSNIANFGSPEDSVRNFMTATLNLPSDIVQNMQFLKCYKVGPPAPSSGSTNDNRTIIVHFLKPADTQLVKNAAFRKPKGTQGGVREDLPYAWATKRTELYKKFIQPARQDPEVIKPLKIKWRGADLEMNGVKIQPDASYQAIKHRLKNN